MLHESERNHRFSQEGVVGQQIHELSQSSHVVGSPMGHTLELLVEAIDLGSSLSQPAGILLHHGDFVGHILHE